MKRFRGFPFLDGHHVSGSVCVRRKSTIQHQLDCVIFPNGFRTLHGRQNQHHRFSSTAGRRRK